MTNLVRIGLPMFRLVSVLFLALLLAATSSAADFTGVGSWKGQIGKFSPKTDFTRFELTIQQSGPKTYQVMIEVVHKTGDTGDQQFQITCDGKERPFKLTGANTHSDRTAVCTQASSSDLTLRQMEKGKQITENEFMVSSDGKMMTYVLTELSDNQTYRFFLKKQ